ncbi:hypothetical protein DTO169C6_7243 [Paecilomyces variotii]|nr:hypothetical protein DTO169C6_7243 [Paecilomyces variotii]
MDLEDTILNGLPPNTKQYEYKGLQNLWSLVSLEQERFRRDKTGKTSQYMLFTNIENETFLHDFDISKHKSSWQLLDSYYPFAQVLLIRMLTYKDHERTHMALVNLMIFKLSSMNGANLELDWTGSADIATPSRTKRADQEVAPQEIPPGRSDQWPSLVIEAGFSESKSKLESDGRWWLVESHGDVKTALTIDVNRRRPEIVIQKWVPICTGQNRTRSQISPTLQQQVVLSRQHDEQEATVSNGPLVLPFQDLFLRPPGKAESDIEFTDSDLRELSKMVWKKQKFLSK